MARRPVGLLFVIAALALLYFAFRSRQPGNAGIGPWAGGPATPATVSTRPPARETETVRIATWNWEGWDERRLGDAAATALLAQVVRQFDVIAVQGISPRSPNALPELCDRVNDDGSHYDYVIGPRVGRGEPKAQYAFLFDRSIIEVDRNQTYTVRDDDDLLDREPLVAWFRARGPDPREAFTFSMVNAQIDPEDAAREINLMDDVLRAVRNDGLDEDDVLLAGDLSVDDRHYGELGRVPRLLAVAAGLSTTLDGTAQRDNLLLDEQSSVEFTGRGGTMDFLREFNLTVAQARSVAPRLPVWGEFSVYEGGGPGRFATRPVRPTGFAWPR
ncbi:MAG: endonuclease/exonuclease/phosphatase [Planctomycetota bacterium]